MCEIDMSLIQKNSKVKDTEYVFTHSGDLISRREIAQIFNTGYNPNETKIYGEISYWCRGDEMLKVDNEKKCSIKLSPDQTDPLKLLISIGKFQSDALQILASNNMLEKLDYAIKEAAMFTSRLTPMQANLIYLLAEELAEVNSEIFPFAVEAIVNNRLTSATQIEALVIVNEEVDKKLLTWAEVKGRHTQRTNALEELPCNFFDKYEILRVYYNTVQLSRVWIENENDLPAPRARRLEILIQIFANLYEPALYLYIPLVAKMIGLEVLNKAWHIRETVLYLLPISSKRKVRVREIIKEVIKMKPDKLKTKIKKIYNEDKLEKITDTFTPSYLNPI